MIGTKGSETSSFKDFVSDIDIYYLGILFALHQLKGNEGQVVRFDVMSNQMWVIIFRRHILHIVVQYCLDLRKPDLRKNLDLRKIVATTDFLVHKLFDLRKIF